MRKTNEERLCHARMMLANAQSAFAQVACEVCESSLRKSPALIKKIVAANDALDSLEATFNRVAKRQIKQRR